MKKKNFIKLKCMLFLFLLFTMFNCYSTNFYVATNGNNSNTGTLLSPFGTIDYVVNNKMNPGDILFVRGGIYKFSTYLRKSGTASALITIKNYPGEMPELNGWSSNGQMSTGNGFGNDSGAYLSNIKIEGFYITGFYRGIGFNWCNECNTSLSNSNQTQNNAGNNRGNNIQIVYNVVDGCGQNGISVNFTSNVVVERNVVSRTGYEKNSGSWSSGISLLGVSGNNRVDSNVSFHHIDVSGNNTDGNGIIIDLSYDGINGNANTRVTNNICFNNGGAGISITRSSKVTVLNNSTYNNVQTLGAFWGELTISTFGAYTNLNNIKLINNIFYPKKGGKSIGVDGRYPQYLALNTNNLLGLGVLQYKNAGGRDFSLKTSQSTAIDKGNDNYNYVTNDNGFKLTDILVAGTDAGSPSWYTHKPNVATIKSKGGLSGCFVTHARKQMSATDIGAIESPVSEATLANDTFETTNGFMMVFPNPVTNNQINIQLNSAIKSNVAVAIYNIQGKKVYSNSLVVDGASFTIQSGNISMGTYILELMQDNKKHISKLIVL